jgi:uncharacterized membrane protein
LRANYLDSLRGIAVIWMVIFHTAYDLNIFQFVSWDFSTGFWYAFPRVIAFTFLFCVGASLNYTHRPQINWNSLIKRSQKLGLAALIISVSTYFMFPSNWIYFGTLHCIFMGSILGALLVNKRKLALVILILILIGQYALDFDIKWVSSLTKRQSMDFIPIYPWFWPILLGILIQPFLSKLSILQEIKPNRYLNFLGQNSLKIYLIHQPVIFGLIWMIRQLLVR